MNVFSAIEDAVLEALQPMKDSGAIKTLAVYSGQLNADTLDDITYSFPCVYCVVGNMAVVPKNQLEEATCDVQLIVGTFALRANETADRIESELSKVRGLYVLIENIRYYLSGLRFYNNWTHLRLNSVAQEVYNPELAICLYSLKYTARGFLAAPALI